MPKLTICQKFSDNENGLLKCHNTVELDQIRMLEVSEIRIEIAGRFISTHKCGKFHGCQVYTESDLECP